MDDGRRTGELARLAEADADSFTSAYLRAHTLITISKLPGLTRCRALIAKALASDEWRLTLDALTLAEPGAVRALLEEWGRFLEGSAYASPLHQIDARPAN
jgi:hypothetical protein